MAIFVSLQCQSQTSLTLLEEYYESIAFFVIIGLRDIEVISL